MVAPNPRREGKQNSCQALRPSSPMMEVKVTIETLPYEVLERILSSPCVTIEDVVSCSLTCKYLNGVCQRNSLWRSKFGHQYPYTYNYIHSKERKDWKVKYVAQYRCKVRLVQCVLALSRTFVWSMYHDYEWPDIPRRALALYEDLFSDALGEANNHYVLDECHNILNSGNPCMELTLKYYADKLHRHTYERLVISSKWHEFLSRGHCYEEGLLWVVVGLRPVPKMCSESGVRASLDRLAQETLLHIKEAYPSNPLSTKALSDEDLACKDSSQWRGEHCFEILQAVHHVLKHKSGYKVNNSLCESEPDHYCIDYVLHHKKGSSKLLLAIQLCVARRLGVSAVLHQNLSDHVLATWKLYYVGQDGASGYMDTCDLCKKDLCVL